MIQRRTVWIYIDNNEKSKIIKAKRIKDISYANTNKFRCFQN